MQCPIRSWVLRGDCDTYALEYPHSTYFWGSEIIALDVCIMEVSNQTRDSLPLPVSFSGPWRRQDGQTEMQIFFFFVGTETLKH